DRCLKPFEDNANKPLDGNLTLSVYDCGRQALKNVCYTPGDPTTEGQCLSLDGLLRTSQTSASFLATCSSTLAGLNDSAQTQVLGCMQDALGAPTAEGVGAKVQANTDGDQLLDSCVEGLTPLSATK